jgi:capsid assembly protease
MNTLKLFAGDLWAIDEGKFQQILAFVEARMGMRESSDGLTAKDIARLEARAAAEKLDPANGAIGVIPLFGVISRRASLLDGSGGVSLERVSRDFNTMLVEPAVSTIILNIDSPGGAVSGVQEFAAEVYKARRKKEIIALADTMAASAAYWIGSAATKFYATPSSDVGSIGVIGIHADESKANEKDGINYTVITAGEYKAELQPYSPLTADARAMLQARADAVYDTFTGDVAKHRGTTQPRVKADYGKGRVIRAPDALATGMIDRITTFKEIVQELTATKAVSQRRLTSYQERRATLAARFPHAFGAKK